MALVIKKIKNRAYYYSFLSYRLLDKPKSFSKYIGVTKPTESKLKRTENLFKDELILKLSGKRYSAAFMSKDDVIKTLLFSGLFAKRYQTLREFNKRKYDIDSTISFILTTLTTEEVDVDLSDVRNAFEKTSGLTEKEQISKNMLRAVESIKEHHLLDKNYLLKLHDIIMANFKDKTPGRFRERQVYLKRKGEHDAGGMELAYRPPRYTEIDKLLNEFLEWHNSNNLNPIEKAALAHYKFYRIHPFLDGNKRICRLIFNKILIENGFPLINISREKEDYFNALATSVEKNEPKTFVIFCLKQYYTQVKEFLKS